jgi:DNA polymerase III delta prime subunit
MIKAETSPEIELIYSPIVNYAIQQNRVPVVRSLVIQNNQNEELSNIEIEIFSEPEFANSWKYQIDFIPKNQSLRVDVRKFKIFGKFLSELTEKINGELIVAVYQEGEVLLKESFPIELLAYDQWGGIVNLPEMLAAFVTPNHPEISKILNSASSILNNWTGNPSFDAYQSLNPDRVKKQMAAVYEAIAALELIYCSPPASFEKEGQRIRMCDTIFSQKLATCIDISLLYTACLEAIGLNPLLIVINGHAFTGCWLIDETFPDSINDDVSLIKKRTASGINEIGLVESTFMNAGQKVSFDEAMNAANYKLVNEDDFILFLDIKRARFSGIKPLPQRVKTEDGWEIVEHEAEKWISEAPEQIDVEKYELDNSNIPVTKQKLWERKLLDLSLRNNLLNMRVTQSTIQLVSVTLNSFEDALAGGEEFQILPKPGDWVNPLCISNVYQEVNKSDTIVDLLKHELSQNKLRSYFTENELSKALTKLYRSSRLSLEENGANTLYLALGFLKWYETSKSELPRYAPLLLLPVEIIRKSAQKGYIIRNREEETLMNITLLEMLRQDFGIVISGLEELPRDESGVDVQRIFNIVRKGIMSQPRWDVEEHAFLGIFSFNKFIMWNDIHHNAEKLKENKIVASLISGKIEWDAEESLTEMSNPDKTYLPSEIALPISADSSQLEAIFAAVQDKSFILHGPPGTGKSQTITNIIANALYQGKKVLFVAEKMAALSVVQKRLTDIGLDPFCLELHSNKAKKSTVLEQLQKTTEVIKKSSPLEYQTEAERLHTLRNELNDYVEALHKKYQFGYSLYDCFTGYALLNETPDKINLNEIIIKESDQEKIDELVELVDELQATGTICGHPFNHPLTEIQTTSYSQQLRTKAYELISNYIDLLAELNQNREKLLSLLNVDSLFYSRKQDAALFEIAEEILALPDTPDEIWNCSNVEQTLGNIIEISNHGIKRDKYRNELLTDFSKNILTFEAESALVNWNQASKKWFLPKFLGQQKIVNTLKPFSKTGKIKKHEIETVLEKIIDFREEQRTLDSNTELLSRMLEFLWQNGNSDWKKVIQICEAVIKIHKAVLSITSDVSKSKLVRSNLSTDFSEGAQTYISLKGKFLRSFKESFEKVKDRENELSELLDIDFSDNTNQSQDWITVWNQKALNWQQNLDDLRDWTSWNHSVHKVRKAGLSPVVQAYQQGELKNKEVLDSFKKAFFRQCSEYIISNEPQLSAFNGKLFENKIRKFREKSLYFEELTKAELFAKLASDIPSFTREAAKSSEIGILQRAIRSKGRGMSLRRLFDLIPNLLPRMCPCMLMSPISVAQYFEIDQTKFDLIVFDEASQMPTSEAVGAIARGKNVIVVGDPKQMPPTSFFSTNNFDEENAEKEDLESILDDCLALSMPSKHLLWHYRSKHESLIAFSNSNYYDNKLMTFPSPDDIATKVSNVYVPGYYDRGKTRQNKFEAAAIIEEVIRMLADSELSRRSIGIVTFSSAQQNLIEDLLNEAFKQRPELESVALESTEPIFIKNLENVQGDERDVILFSMGYGPDKNGSISLNFGPLNREGGWRRLNVAVSRARYEMKVFSTLRFDQIDITRTSSEGVAGIKAFLEYSEKGKKVLTQKNFFPKDKTNSFENHIAEELRKFGYDVHTNIGCSGYRIDIGVVNPENLSEYILGILTDGENYKSAKTAKDREMVRMQVLQLLGWNVYKLWSPDWWDNPGKVLQEIKIAIEIAHNPAGTVSDSTEHTEPVETIATPKREQYAGVKLQGITQHVIETNREYPVYKICLLPATFLNFSDEFFDTRRTQKILNQILQVIQKEAPISQNLLSKRILVAWGIGRLGVRLKEYLDGLYGSLNLKYTRQNGTYFYWKQEQSPETYNTFRISENDDQKRSAEDLPKEEITAGVVEILTNQISLPVDDLVKETARLFGYARLGGNVEQAMKTGIEYALKKGIIAENNERIVLN